MKKITCLKYLTPLHMSSLLLVPSLQARPNTSVKSTLSRVENQEKGTKNKLILPYAFSTESMGFTMGVGGGQRDMARSSYCWAQLHFTA